MLNIGENIESEGESDEIPEQSQFTRRATFTFQTAAQVEFPQMMKQLSQALKLRVQKELLHQAESAKILTSFEGLDTITEQTSESELVVAIKSNDIPNVRILLAN